MCQCLIVAVFFMHIAVIVDDLLSNYRQIEKYVQNKKNKLTMKSMALGQLQLKMKGADRNYKTNMIVSPLWISDYRGAGCIAVRVR